MEEDHLFFFQIWTQCLSMSFNTVLKRKRICEMNRLKIAMSFAILADFFFRKKRKRISVRRSCLLKSGPAQQSANVLATRKQHQFMPPESLHQNNVPSVYFLLQICF